MKEGEGDGGGEEESDEDDDESSSEEVEGGEDDFSFLPPTKFDEMNDSLFL